MARPTSGQVWPRIINPPPIVVSEAGVEIVGDLREIDFLANATVVDGGSGVAEVTPTGGGGGGGFPESAPDTPSAYDDEFVTDTLDAKWTVTSAGNAAGAVIDNDKYGSWLSSRGPGSGTNALTRYVIQQNLSGFPSGTAFAVTFRVSVRQTGNDTGVTCELYVSNAADTSSFFCGLQPNGTGQFRINLFDGSSTTVNLGDAITGLWFHIQRDTSNAIRYYVSTDGVGFRRFYTGTAAFDFDRLGIFTSRGGSGSQYSELLVDFVRVNDARFNQPSA